MALHCNGYRLGFSPFTLRGGALITIYTPARTLRALQSPGGIRGWSWTFGTLSALPQGGNYPSAWMLPQMAGGMASHNRCALTVAASGAGALGLNAVGSAAITINSTALGGLIAGGVGSATISLTASGSIVATIGSSGSATITIGGVADPGALGWMTGQADVNITGALISYAIGHMVGTTEESGLTPTGVANAVWNKIIEAGFSANEILRLLAAHAAGDADGLEGATTEFMSLDGSKPRITGSVAAGVRTITDRDVT